MAVWALVVAVCLVVSPGISQAWGSGKRDKVLLRDVETLTLKDGYMTTGRRSSPVAQLRCIGGSAGCREFTPRSVQCYNRGFDGHDVNWECKTDMDDDYRFGQITVSCEGYDHPDDKYILKGSCGLEYEIDWTRHGKQSRGSGSYFGHDDYHYDSGHHGKRHRGSWTDSTWMILVVVGVVMYAVHRYRRMSEDDEDSHDDDDRSSSSSHRGDGPPTYSQSQAHYKHPSGQSTHSTAGASHNSTATGGAQAGAGGWGGFFGGATAGGLLGYFLGSRNRAHYDHYGYQQHHHRPRHGFGSGWGSGGGWGSSWGSGNSWGSGGGWGSSRGSSWGSSSHRSSSGSGSRTTSGFGSTSRR